MRRTVLRAPSQPTRTRARRVNRSPARPIWTVTPSSSCSKLSTVAPGRCSARPSRRAWAARESFHCSHWRRYGWAVSPASTARSNTARAPLGCRRTCQCGQGRPCARRGAARPIRSSRSSVGGWKVLARRSSPIVGSRSTTAHVQPGFGQQQSEGEAHGAAARNDDVQHGGAPARSDDRSGLQGAARRAGHGGGVCVARPGGGADTAGEHDGGAGVRRAVAPGGRDGERPDGERGGQHGRAAGRVFPGPRSRRPRSSRTRRWA